MREKKQKKQLNLMRVFGSLLCASFIAWIPVIILTIVSFIVHFDDIPQNLVFPFVFTSRSPHSLRSSLSKSCKGCHLLSKVNKHWCNSKFAIELEDTDLLAKFAPSDMIALEGKYEHINEPHVDLHGIAFAELVAFMNDFHSEGVALVFKLAVCTSPN